VKIHGMDGTNERMKKRRRRRRKNTSSAR